MLLHGYGADENDLFALVPYLPPEFVVAAVRAPLAPPWPAPGYSWYAIEGLDGRDPEPVTLAARQLIGWLDAVGRGAASIGLLGFSQGASVALQALRLEPERFDFVVNLSGYAAPGPLPGDAALAESRPPVFWGRGTHDDVIPEFLIAHTTEWLPGALDAERAGLPRAHAQRLGARTRRRARVPRQAPRGWGGGDAAPTGDPVRR